MEIPRGLFYFYTFFFAVLAVVAFVRAHREKKRIFYVSGGLCLLGSGWSLLFVLDQALLGGLFWVVAMIISIVMLPELNKFEVDQMREVDIAGPLKIADFFSKSNNGWLKLAYKRGLGMSVVLYTMQFAVVGVMMLLGLNLFYPSLMGFILPAVIGGAIFTVIRFHILIKRALTSIRLPSGSPPSPSTPQNRPRPRPAGQ